MNIQSFLSFNKMITPTIIKIIFIVGVCFSVLTGLFQVIVGLSSSFGGGLQVFLGLMTIIIGPFLTRIYCEILILFFKMHETLVEMNEKLGATERR